MKWNIILLLLIVFVVASCTKKNKLSNIPKITFESLNHDSVKAGNSEDSITINFKFEDGDADLGVNPSSGNFDIYITDSRDTSTHFNFFLPTIPSDFKDPSLGLVGYASVSIKASFLILDSLHVNGDSLHYDVYMKDIAGHESNHFETPEIYIRL